MKKIILLFGLTLLLTACGNSDSIKGATDSETTNKTNVTDVKEMDAEPVDAVVEEPQTPKVNLNEMITIADFAEFTVKGNTFGKVINPPNPGSFYTYYENKEIDQIYLDTTISIKSLLTSGKSSDEFASVKVIYDSKYEYSTFSSIEDAGGSDFTYTNITDIEPLQTGTLHYLASVPSSIESDSKPLKAIITINGTEYEQIIR